MPHMARTNSLFSPPKDTPAKMESLYLDSSPDFGPVSRPSSKVRPIGEMISPVIPQSGYRERSGRLKKLEEDKNALIDELISKLEASQQQLSQFHLDQDRNAQQNYQNEQITDALQQEVDAVRSLLHRNSYVTVLIDGDSLTFAKEYLNKGEKGGSEVAQAIYDSVHRFALEALPGMESFKVHIKLFADIKTLSENLICAKIIDKVATLEGFLRGLVGSQIWVDVVDTSLMKGLTTKKLKEAYQHDFVNVHCYQIFLAATATNEFNCLLDETPDIPVHERVTFLEVPGLPSRDQFQHEIAAIKIDVPIIKVPTGVSLEQNANKLASPMLARIPSTSSTKTMNSAPMATSAASTPMLSWAALTAQPFVPKPGEPRPGVLTPMSMNTPPVAKATIVEVPRNKHGQRVDPVDTSIPYQDLQQIKRLKLCNIYYLVGKNECAGNCKHSHTYPLSKQEKPVLKEVARMTPCHNRTDCSDISCIYGHRCPQNKPDKKDCFYKDQCRFHGWGHGIDEKVVKVRNIK